MQQAYVAVYTNTRADLLTMLTIAYLQFINNWMRWLKRVITAWPGSAAASFGHSTGLRCWHSACLHPVLLCYRKSDGLISCFVGTAIATVAATTLEGSELATVVQVHSDCLSPS